MTKRNSAFDVKMTQSERDILAQDLCQQIEDAISMRSTMIADGGLIDLSDWFYEQGRSDPADRPFEGAADLTSFFITENVDGMKAQLVDAACNVEPFCMVDGWGQDHAKAPFVEAFHEWQVEEEGLPEEIDKLILGGLLEDCHILEVRERIETRRITETMDVALDLHEGAAVFGPDHKPKILLDEDGEPVPAQAGQASAKVERTHTKTKRLGPEYDLISMKDFVFLPGHAKNQRQVRGYAYRFWQRVPEINERVQDDIYDKAAVESIGDESDRDMTAVPTSVDGVQAQEGPANEKELWTVCIKQDLDEDGREEWYVITLSLKKRTILRLKLDLFVMKVGRPRCVPLVLFPRRNSVYGYSYSIDKMMTLAEEHTGTRNAFADRNALAANAPMTRRASAMVDLDAQPWGVGAVIDVRDHDDLKQMVVADVPQSAIYWLRQLHVDKERVGMLSDTSNGVQSAERRTLGENQMVSRGSSVKVRSPLSQLRRCISAIMQLRHAIWIETLEDPSNSKGLEAPATVLDRLAANNTPLEGGRFTADQLKGKFRFKPYGSVDTADSAMRMQYFNQGLIALGNMAKMMPAIQMIFQSPEVAVRTVQEWARVYKNRDVNVFLKALQPPVAPMLPQASGMSGGDPMAADPNAAPLGGDPMQAIMAMLSQGGQPPTGGDGGEFVSYE